MKSIATFLIGLTLSASALADGMLLKSTQLPTKDRTQLSEAIASYKSEHPEAFEKLRGVRGHRPENYSEFRNPVPMVDRELRHMGPSILLPMLDALAFSAPARDNLTDAEWEALQRGILNAVGTLRDARSEPVLRAILETAKASAPVLQETAEALGRLCSDSATSFLVQKSSSKSTTAQEAAIAGLGQCRRVESVKQLSSLMKSTKDENKAMLIADALGTVGSSWAWRAMGSVADTIGVEVRDQAAQSLVEGLVRFQGETQNKIAKSLLKVESNKTRTYAEKVRANANEKTIQLLDKTLTKIDSQLARSKK